MRYFEINFQYSFIYLRYFVNVQFFPKALIFWYFESILWFFEFNIQCFVIRVRARVRIRFRVKG